MLVVKFSASDLKIIRKATYPAEFEGVVQLVRDRIARHETLKSLGKPEPAAKAAVFTWRQAFEAAKSVLGVGVTMPPAPESKWFSRINTHLREYQLGEAEVRAIAEYARDHLSPSNKFDFLICQHERILAGAFDIKGKGPVATAPVIPELPEV